MNFIWVAKESSTNVCSKQCMYMYRYLLPSLPYSAKITWPGQGYVTRQEFHSFLELRKNQNITTVDTFLDI